MWHSRMDLRPFVEDGGFCRGGGGGGDEDMSEDLFLGSVFGGEEERVRNWVPFSGDNLERRINS